MIWVHFQGKPINITVTQVYAPTNDAEEAEDDQFYDDLEDLLELTPKKKKKRCPFHHRGLGSQEIPGITGKFGFGVQNKA